MPFTSGAIGKLASWQPCEHAPAHTQSENLVESEEARFIKAYANSQVSDSIFVLPFIYGICLI